MQRFFKVILDAPYPEGKNYTLQCGFISPSSSLPILPFPPPHPPSTMLWKWALIYLVRRAIGLGAQRWAFFSC